MLGALVGGRGAGDEEVVQVVVDVAYPPVPGQPLDCLSQAVENERR